MKPGYLAEVFITRLGQKKKIQEEIEEELSWGTAVKRNIRGEGRDGGKEKEIEEGGRE